MVCTLGFLARRAWERQRDGNTHSLAPAEESLTDYLLLDLKLKHPTRVHVRKFTKVQEGQTTGADWEWWFGNRGSWFGLRVQAKRLDVYRRAYTSLNHVVHGSGRRQIDLLLEDAARHNLYPVYCLYNWLPGKKSIPWKCPCHTDFDPHLGCSLVSAKWAERCLQVPDLSVRAIGDQAFPWMCLLCTGTGTPRGDLAASVRGFVMQHLRQGRIQPYTAEANAPEADPDRLEDIPNLRAELPGYVEAVRGEEREGERAGTDDGPGGRIDGIMIVE